MTKLVCIQGANVEAKSEQKSLMLADYKTHKAHGMSKVPLMLKAGLEKHGGTVQRL